MDNFSVRSERNFHNLAAKPKQMHLLDEPSGYASAMVKSSLSHQMRFTVQALEEELCVAGDPHVLQIKLLGDDSREPSSWMLFADGVCVADGSGAFARECFCEGAEVFLDLCRDAVEAAELPRVGLRWCRQHWPPCRAGLVESPCGMATSRLTDTYLI